MKKVLNVGFGSKTLYQMYRSADMSSRLVYGLDLLSDNYQVDFESFKQFTLKGHIKNNLMVLRPYDVVFQIYLYIQPIVLLACLRRLGLFRRRKLVAISHVPLKVGKSRLQHWALQFIYGAFDKILFHSQRNLEESVERGMIKASKCEFLYWGDDLDYVDSHLTITQGNYFLSTGRECRDYDLMISAFSKMPQVPLHIYTNRVNYGADYSFLEQYQGKYDNVSLEFVEKSTDTTRFLQQQTAGCRCIVVPIIVKDIYYCVGLTSVVEAMAMSKPVISTRNPYSPVDIEKERIGFFVDDEQSWITAINYLATHPEEAAEMGRRARKLAEEKFNVRRCAEQLERVFGE